LIKEIPRWFATADGPVAPLTPILAPAKLENLAPEDAEDDE